MSDLQVVFLVLAAVYAWECICWIRRGSVAFLNRGGARWRVAHPGAVAGNQNGGIIPAHPLPPLGTVFVVSQSPLSLSPTGIFSHVAQCLNPGWRPPQPAIYFPFAGIKNITAQGRVLRVDGRLLVKANSPRLAARLAAQLTELTALPEKKRAAALQLQRRQSLDSHAVRQRLHQFEAEAPKISWLANGLFLYLFVLAPACIVRFGIVSSWLELAGGLLLLTAATAILFARAHRRLYPDAAEERLTHCLLIWLSPATSIRARDALSRPLLEEFHPLAVAKVLLPAADFKKFSRTILLELRHPIRPPCPVNDPTVQELERESRSNLLASVETFLEQHGEKLAELGGPPSRSESSCKSYCPRCNAQFTVAAGQCVDCGGLPLVAFTALLNQPE